jgi:hypothetical protein
MSRLIRMHQVLIEEFGVRFPVGEGEEREQIESDDALLAGGEGLDARPQVLTGAPMPFTLAPAFSCVQTAASILSGMNAQAAVCRHVVAPG